MRIGSCVRSAFAATIISAAGPAANAQEGFTGRTMIASFTVHQAHCLPGAASCTPLEAVPLNTNIYFGKRGELFDYGSGRTGLRRKFGVTYREAQDNRWEIRGSRIVRTISVPQFTDIYTYTAVGSHCAIHVQRRMKPGVPGHFVMRADVSRCQLVDGLQER